MPKEEGMRTSLRLASLVTVLTIALGTTAFAQRIRPSFPPDHRDRLGGASYAAFFGHDTQALTPTSVAATTHSLLPIVGPNVRVNAPQQPPFGRSETTIATNATGNRLVAGWNDAEGFLRPPFGTGPGTPGLSGYGYSTDGGQTWTDGDAPPNFNGVVTRGDPWLDSDGLNLFYFANLAVDEAGNSLGLSVHRGSFKGSGFSWNDVRVFDSPRNATSPGADFYDKEALAAGNPKTDLSAAYVSVTNFQELCGNPQFGFGQIEVWRTYDRGNTWQGPAIAGPEAPDSVASCGFLGTLQQSSVPAIGPNGEVYVVWQYGPFFAEDGSVSTDADIVVARSLDRGASFEPPVKVADINSMRQNPPVGYNRERINDHPRITVATDGPYKGRVFVTYYSASASTVGAGTVPCPPGTAPGVVCVGPTLTSSQVFVRYSDDQGKTWSAARRVVPTPPRQGVKRFWPVVTVPPGGTKVDVVYYQSREAQATPDPGDIECNVSIAPGGVQRRVSTVSSLVDTYRVQSLDGGQTWSTPVLVSSATSNWCTTVSNIRPNFGDYIDSKSTPNATHLVWADGRNGVPDTFYATVAGSEK
jgi:hypothetical protein